MTANVGICTDVTVNLRIKPRTGFKTILGCVDVCSSVCTDVTECGVWTQRREVVEGSKHVVVELPPG